ncbi:CPBP family intramembrane glutamic endopeptidase [Dactylosporangium sp. NPDC005572]|uniref:CPBP family intramembrane glutamic endopeptidase n=1 Tax=Dactylosporangium sp. NPDC005572 TaxID=3156889 RepID=UPI0033BB6251
MTTTAARTETAVFVALQAVLALACTAVAVAEGVDVRHIEDATPLGQAVTYGTALTPLIAALVARLSLPSGRGLRLLAGRGWRGWGFRRTSPRTLLLAWAFGLVPVLAAYLGVWTTGAGRFDGSLSDGLLAATVLTLPYVLLALAEDIGWRGLLVARLAEFARPRTVYLVSGVAWSLSHLWLILFLGGAPEGVPPLYAVATFTVATTALGTILAAMQLRWGIWPGVVAHATVNAVMYHFAEPSTASANNWIATETGLAYALAMVLAAAVYLRWFAGAAVHQRHTSDRVDASIAS